MIDNVTRFWFALWLIRLDELRRLLGKEIMPFPEVRSKLCTSFQINWGLCKKFIHKLWKEGYVEVISCHGVQISSYGKVIIELIKEKREDFELDIENN